MTIKSSFHDQADEESWETTSEEAVHLNKEIEVTAWCTYWDCKNKGVRRSKFVGQDHATRGQRRGRLIVLGVIPPYEDEEENLQQEEPKVLRGRKPLTNREAIKEGWLDYIDELDESATH